MKKKKLSQTEFDLLFFFFTLLSGVLHSDSCNQNYSIPIANRFIGKIYSGLQ